MNRIAQVLLIPLLLSTGSCGFATAPGAGLSDLSIKLKCPTNTNLGKLELKFINLSPLSMRPMLKFMLFDGSDNVVTETYGRFNNIMGSKSQTITSGHFQNCTSVKKVMVLEATDLQQSGRLSIVEIVVPHIGTGRYSYEIESLSDRTYTVN